LPKRVFNSTQQYFRLVVVSLLPSGGGGLRGGKYGQTSNRRETCQSSQTGCMKPQGVNDLACNIRPSSP